MNVKITKIIPKKAEIVPMPKYEPKSDDDFYSHDSIMSMREDDMISSAEAAFMQGYLSA